MKPKNLHRTWIALGLVSAIVLATSPATRGQGAGVQAFTGATLIDGDGARIDNAVLVIRDGRVVSAGRSGAVSIPRVARRIPLAGKFVTPGLISGTSTSRMFSGWHRAPTPTRTRAGNSACSHAMGLRLS